MGTGALRSSAGRSISPISAANPRPRRFLKDHHSSFGLFLNCFVVESIGLSGLQLSLALDNFRCELQIGLTAGAFQIVENCRFTV